MSTNAQPDLLSPLEGLTPGEAAEALTQIRSIRPEPGYFETMAEKALLEELLCAGDQDPGLTV